MTRKVAGRWKNGKLTEHVVDYGPSHAYRGHGRKMDPIFSFGGTAHVNVRGGHGHMQAGSKRPPSASG